MNLLKDFNGIIGVVNTPFTNDNRIDTESLKRYVNHSIACGVVGFLVPAIAAEINKLDRDERRVIVKTVVDEVAGRVIVIGGASALDRESRMYYVNELNDLGCDGVLVNIPFVDEAEYIKQINEIAGFNPKFLMIQDWNFNQYGLPVKVIKKLFDEVEVFKSLKIEVVPAGVKYSDVINATGGKLHVAGGWAGSQMIEGLDRGVNAFMSTILHDVYSKIFELHKSGERERAEKLFYELVSILAFSHQHIDISIHFNKRLVHTQGIFSTPNVREPILPFDKYHEKIADELIHKAIHICSTLENY